jgi:hypothetical protein
MIKAALNVGQDISASSDGAISGTTVSFPPLGIVTDTEITIEEAAQIATATVASQLGLGENIAETGIAIAVFSREGSEPALPYTITLPVPPVPELQIQDDTSTLVIFYKVKSVAKDQILLGAIPFAKLNLQGDSVKFSVTHFGAFQAAYTKLLLTEAKEVTATTPIQTRREVLELVPFVISSRTPFIVSTGDQVTVKGTGFRPSMSVAFGGLKVTNFKVESETSATFFPPSKTKFGITDLTANQDGIEQTVTVFYRGNKDDLPLITLTEPEVCSEFKYYDSIGDVKTGTRGCDKAAISLTDNNYAHFAGPWSIPICARDGQAGCMTTERFRSADSDPSAISPWDLRQGKTLAGIHGRLKFCKNTANLAVYDEKRSPEAVGPDEFTTIDDNTNNVRGTPEDFSSNLDQVCDESGWQSGGIDSGITPGFCNEVEDQCTYEDLITGLTWSEGTTSTVTWLNALAVCTGTIAGYSDWRTPTMKELNQAAIDGIKSVSSPNFLVIDSSRIYWSGTTNSLQTTQAWAVNLAAGAAESVAKNMPRYTACVRH